MHTHTCAHVHLYTCTIHLHVQAYTATKEDFIKEIISRIVLKATASTMAKEKHLTSFFFNAQIPSLHTRLYFCFVKDIS